jgi:CBS domain containing-hemolysin-like protein
MNTLDTNTIASLIQLSVAPVFLLAGIAGLLNVFTSRLSRIIDKVDKLDKFENDTKEKSQEIIDLIKRRREFLTMRMRNTNRAIFFGTLTGLLIALVIITIFLTSFFHFEHVIYIGVLFILAMLSLVISLVLFLRELFYTTKFINNKQSYIP